MVRSAAKNLSASSTVPTVRDSEKPWKDASRVQHTMRGGFGASWHAIEQPLPMVGGVSHGGSAWGANPPASNDRAWRDIYRHADWLGLDFVRVEIDVVENNGGIPAMAQGSIHSGSDKFSLYPIMHRALKRANAGVHLKTAGTTWLEEMLGLAEAGGDGLAFAKALYREACSRYDEMAKPYATVIAIDRQALPAPDEVDLWGGREFVEALEHNQGCARFSIHFRQLIHISFRIAAEKRAQLLELLRANREKVEARVSYNILKRHIEPLFLGVSE